MGSWRFFLYDNLINPDVQKNKMYIIEKKQIKSLSFKLKYSHKSSIST